MSPSHPSLLAGKSPAALLRRIAGAAARRMRARVQDVQDGLWSSEGADLPDWNPAILIPGHLSLNDIARSGDLLAESKTLLAHRLTVFGHMDLDLGFGAAAPGRRGVRFGPVPGIPVLSGKRAQSRFALISHGEFRLADYRPIDWFRDPVSGYRWPTRQSWRKVPIAPAEGADIKALWEPARLQHLPRMALAARAASGPDAIRLVSEIRAQALDFLASNPPRRGPNWRSVMEVAIRGANLTLAMAIVEKAGHHLDQDARSAIGGSRPAP